MDSREHTIEVEKLYKRFGKIEAVNGISFQVGKGQIVGFLGPNGAGKSTTMRILTGYTRASSGVAKICGLPVISHPHKIKRKIGYMPENNPLPSELRVREYLKWRAKMKEIPFSKRRRAIDAVLERCDLTRAQDRIIGKLSKGFRQRVGIADTVLANPEVIIMDEPTIGLDPHQVILIRDLIANLRGRMTVIISSHILPEIEMSCDQIIIINGGKIVGQGSPASLRKTFINFTAYELEIAGKVEDLESALATFAPKFDVDKIGPVDPSGFSRIEIRINDNHDLGEQLIHLLAQDQKIRLRSLRRKQAPLEDVFLAATRRSWETVDENLAAADSEEDPNLPPQSTSSPSSEQTLPDPSPPSPTASAAASTSSPPETTAPEPPSEDKNLIPFDPPTASSTEADAPAPPTQSEEKPKTNNP